MIDQMKVESSTRLKEHDGLEQLLVKTSQEKMALHYDKKQSLKEIALKVNIIEAGVLTVVIISYTPTYINPYTDVVLIVPLLAETPDIT